MARKSSRPARPSAPNAQATLDALQDAASDRVFGIAELAREFSISTRTIRFYEDKGLLSPARINQTRVFSRKDRARLALILRAKAIGSSLEDIRHYLDLYGHHGEGRRKQLEYVLEKTGAAMAALEEKKAQLERSLAELRLIRDTALRQLRQRRH